MIEATRQQGDKSAGVYLSPTEEKLKTFLEISTPSSKKEVQRIGGLAAQLKRWTPGLMLEFPGIQKLCANSVSFYWNADLELELNRMKEAISQHVKLSPLDVEKDLILWTDAAPSVGMAYVLCQEKEPGNEKAGYNIIICDSTTFKKGKTTYSPFEAELAAIHWACTKEDYYMKGAQTIITKCDAKNMGSILAQDLDKISNPREQKMVERLMPYNITVHHVPGKETEVADFGSRHPAQEGSHEMFDTEPGRLGIMVRSRRVMSLDVVDPKVEILAAMASRDLNYLKMIENIQAETDKKHLPADSELKMLRGCINDLSTHVTETGFSLIVRRGCEILIPREGRQELVNQLHSSHLSTREMINLARGKFFWPSMAKQLAAAYDGCESCKVNSMTKPTKEYNVIPQSLSMIAPGEQILLDFCQFARKQIMVIKDRVSGYFWAKVCKDQTTNSAVGAVVECSHRYGLPHEVRSDGAGTFRSRFSREMEKLGVTHKLTSPYNSESNGGAERAVRALKHCLNRDGVKQVTQ